MIGIDIRFMTNELKKGKISSGVGLFCSDLLSAFHSLGESGKFILVVNNEESKVVERFFPDYRICVINRKRGLFRSFETKQTEKLLKKNSVDSIWFPHCNPLNFLPLNIRTISTIHDLIMLHENEDSSFWRKGFESILKKSSVVTAVSSFSKDDINQTFPSLNRDIKVIYNPISLDLSIQSPVQCLEGKKFILDVNAYQDRKNPETLLKAYYKIRTDTEADLVFCGGYSENDCFNRLKSCSEKLGIEDRVHCFLAVPLEERNWLLANSLIVVSPSLSEGFGRTPVEAALAVKPVISSKSDSLVEVTQGLVHYYENAEDECALAEVIMSVLKSTGSDSAADELKKISETLRETYSSERIAKQYLSVF